MKETYSTPVVKVEELESSDVLLASPAIKSIEENQTRSFMQFLVRGDWF